MYPLSLERSALLAQASFEAKNSLHAIQTAYEEERERVEEEWRKGRDRVRERLLEGIEERRRRAREEKEGEGAVNGTLSTSTYITGNSSILFPLHRPFTGHSIPYSHYPQTPK